MASLHPLHDDRAAASVSASAEKQDRYGRTLTQALSEDRNVRRNRWLRKLRRLTWPKRVFDVFIVASPVVVLITIVALVFASEVAGSGAWDQWSGPLLLFAVLAFWGYSSLHDRVVEPWMQKRVNRLKAAAQAEGVELSEDYAQP